MELKQFVEEKIEFLQQDDITEITKHKIKYVKDYVNNWIYVMSSFCSCTSINFIDCMCNAGIYKDCTLSTSMEVLKIFIANAEKYPTKEFNLFLNDISADRIKVIKELSEIINEKRLKNINILYDNMDVNIYLSSMDRYKEKFVYGSCSILFVDPYNFGTVKINLLKEFSNKYYSEIIFNYFSSDYRRNIKNENAVSKIENIKKSMDKIEGYNENMNDIEVLELIQKHLKTTKIKYSFAYQFRTSTNVPLYSIVYATPHIRGLEKLKDSLWNTFEGKEFYRNEKENYGCQLSLFDNKELFLNNHSNEAIEKLLAVFNNKLVSYDDIVVYVLENTMLRKGQVLNSVIKPLIKEGKIKKKNINGVKNFTQDEYYVIGDISD